jgi:LysR family transcriptional regulator for bpeEF and oprC
LTAAAKQSDCLYPNRTHSSAAVKAFVEWIAEIFPR